MEICGQALVDMNMVLVTWIRNAYLQGGSNNGGTNTLKGNKQRSEARIAGRPYF